MASSIRNLLASFTKSSKAKDIAQKYRARLNVERLEGREMMTVAPLMPHFTATGISATQIRLNWNAVSGATGYQIDYTLNNGAWTKLSATITGNQTSITLNCSAGALYNFDLIAYNSAGWSAWAPTEKAITNYNPAAAAAYSPASSTATLFGPSGTPSPLAVAQGNEGDCWLIASLAATAAQKPQIIKSMFTYEGTAVESGATVGLYMVRFYNKSNAPVYVTVDTELPGGGKAISAGGYYDQVTNPMGTQALWVALAEKAYAEANGLGYVSATYSGDSYNALNGGDPAWAVHAITGAAADYQGVPSNLAAAWANHDLIVLTSDAGPSNNPYVDPHNPYIVGNHAYAVIGYNSSTAAFTLLNPWGTMANGTSPSKGYNGLNVYGEFNATLAQLAYNFRLTTWVSAPVNTNDHTVSHPDDNFTAPATLSQHGGFSGETTDPWQTPAIQWNAHMQTGLDNLFVDADTLATL